MDVQLVRKLRLLTQAGYSDCKKALEFSGGDLDNAIKHLREIGGRIQEKHSEKMTSHGVIDAYIHPGNRIGALVEVRCETDFVAKTPELRNFVRELAMQIVAMSPKYISQSDISLEIINEKQSAIVASTSTILFYCEEDREKHIKAKMETWFAENCLLDQAYMRDGSVSIQDLLSSLIVSVGENCKITRIQRWEI